MAGDIVVWGGSLGSLLILIIILAACIAIVFVATKAMGVTIPGWAINIFWIVVIAIVAIFAIRLVLSM